MRFFSIMMALVLSIDEYEGVVSVKNMMVYMIFSAFDDV